MEGNKSSKLTFYVNGKKIVEEDVNPETTLLSYLRSNLGLTGTRGACGVGGCGACTIMVSRYNRASKNIVHYSAMSCLIPLCAIHGLSVTTVQGIGSVRNGLHPVQERIAKSHGSQCGFCTPGMVMSMYTLLRNHPQPTAEQIEKALQGNLCRCTGYRPILDGFKTFTKEFCEMGENCCKNQKPEGEKGEESEGLVNCAEFKPLDPSQDPIFPFELQNSDKLDTEMLVFRGDNVTWYRPTSLESLLKLKSQFPDAKLSFGNTKLGHDLKINRESCRVLIVGSSIPELEDVSYTDNGVRLGAAVTIDVLEEELNSAIQNYPEYQTRSFVAIVDMFRRFAGQQIRNMTTIGGSIMAAEPNSDVNVMLLALDAVAEVTSTDGAVRTVKMNKDFFIGKGKTALSSDEVLLNVLVPFTRKSEFCCCYKQGYCRDGSKSIVNACMRVVFYDDSNIVKELCLAYGGISHSTVMLRKTMEKVVGMQWDDSMLTEVCGSLTEELSRSLGSVEGMERYRQTMATSLFFKFYLTVQIQLQNRNITNKDEPTSSAEDVSSVFRSKPTQSSQVFHEVSPGQLAQDPVGKPMAHTSALQHATGESVYIDDIPQIKGELFMAFVCSTKAHAVIKSVDTAEALTMPGVKDYVDHSDVPGPNLWGVIVQDEELFASTKVVCQGQIIGAIMADTRRQAHEAVTHVKIEYEELQSILTIQEAIDAESFYLSPMTLKNGDVDDGFKQAAHVIEGELHIAGQSHFYMETNAVLAVPKGENEEMEIFSSTQSPTLSQMAAAKALGLPGNKITVRVKRVGGGFGGKETRATLYSTCAAVAAYKLQRPVRCVLTREEDMVMTGNRHPVLAKYKVGFTSEGKVLALKLDMFLNAGMSLDLSDAVRELNLYQDGDSTYFNQELSPCLAQRCWDECIKNSCYHTRKEKVDTFNGNNRWKKRGITVVPIRFGMDFNEPFLNQAGALVHVYTDGSVLLTHGGVEMGQGLHTKMIQVASRVLGIPASKILISETGTNTVPNTSPTAASASSDLNGMAVMYACEKIMQQLEPIRKAQPDASWEQWIISAYFQRVSLSASGFYKLPGQNYDSKTNKGVLYNYYSFGAACSEVEIDCLTGDHQVLRTDIVMDVGESLNPAIDIGQIEGGFVQGYGMMMLEEPKISPSGYLHTQGPTSYKIPTFGSIPAEFNVSLLRGSVNKKAVYSSKGIGEPPFLLAMSVFHAVKEAIMSARAETGHHGTFRLDSPATVERVRLACEDQFTTMFPEPKAGTYTPWCVDI